MAGFVIPLAPSAILEPNYDTDGSIAAHEAYFDVGKAAGEGSLLSVTLPSWRCQWYARASLQLVRRERPTSV